MYSKRYHNPSSTYPVGVAMVEIYWCSPIRYYHTLVYDYRERLVEVSAHLLMILLDYSPPAQPGATHPPNAQSGATPTSAPPTAQSGAPPSQQDASQHPANSNSVENLFKLYISRLHQKEVSVGRHYYWFIHNT